MLPVVSTRPLSNFELTLSPDGTRVGNHRCSNLLDYTEVKTHHGFLTDATKNPEVIGETAPYQYSNSLRGSSTLRFYRNLNLEACLWEFTSYYDMSELLNDCGGTIGTDGQVSLSSFELLVIAYPLIPIFKKREDTPYSVLKFLPPILNPYQSFTEVLTTIFPAWFETFTCSLLSIDPC